MAKSFRLSRLLLLSICLVLRLESAPAGAETENSCPLNSNEIVVIQEISPRNELVLDDGRLLYLAGISFGEPLPGEASWAALLKKLTQNAAIRIGAIGDKDRWGRQAAQVFVKPVEAEDEAWLQGFLLEIGAVRLALDRETRLCWARMQKLEDKARLDRLGLWAANDAILRASEPEKIVKKRGEPAMVEGQIIGIGETAGVFYLNFGKSWQKDFTVVILKRHSKLFEAVGLQPKALENKRIRVRGIVDGHSGPRIEAMVPEQIEKLD